MNTPSQIERLARAQRQFAYIKSEMNGSINTIRIRDNAVLLLDLLEYLFYGETTQGDPNFIPGTPASRLEDPTATRVEFVSGPGAVAQAQQRRMVEGPASMPFAPNMPAFAIAPPPQAPVTNGDTQFIRSAPPSASVTFGATGPSGQKVEYLDAQGRPVDAQGRLIDANGNPIQAAPPWAAAASPAPTPFVGPNGYQFPHAGVAQPAQETIAVPSAGPLAAAMMPPAPPNGAPLSHEEAMRMNPIPLAE